MLFASVLLHELAHSLVARARGMPVSSITLFIFGGSSNLEEEPEKPGAEFYMAIVGPLTSLGLAGIFWGLTQTVGNQESPLAAMLNYLALINLILAAFNLIPGFPLDGGRVLRSIIWSATGSLSKATNIAAMVGRFFGWGLVALGFFQLLTGNFLGGLWMAFIGWFLSSAADASRKDLTVRKHLENIKVSEVMNATPESISPETNVEEAVWDIFRKHHGRAMPEKPCERTSC
jgi:Zn-dependent protease